MQFSFQYMVTLGISTMSTAILVTASFPLDMVRTRLQASPELLRLNQISNIYLSYADCFRQILKKEKWQAFWKGNGPNLIRVSISQTSNYTIKQVFQSKIKESGIIETSTLATQLGINFLSGAIGSCLTIPIIYPFDLCRQKLNNDLKGLGTIRSVLYSVYKNQGLRGIYKGALNFFITGVAFRSFYFGIFDTLKQIDRQSLKIRFMAGYIASISAMSVVYPLDTVRKRMIIVAGTSSAYKSLWDCMRIIRKQEGIIQGLFRGFSMTYLQGAVWAIVLCYYDQIGSDIKKINASKNTIQ